MHSGLVGFKSCSDRNCEGNSCCHSCSSTIKVSAVDLSSDQLIGSGGYLDAWLRLQGLNLLLTGCKLRHILLPVDSVPPVLLTTLLQQSHSDRRGL